ncbi:hypothetical protein GMLC_31270 [Geomonas limicola]|uniref:Lipoprotein n=1 Tax=Geomonas limicola TaxID=2740186 RepID=A0A6V8NAC3_9BACT|nr:hypothetical protein [Geomonas limicola]GFO69548.1 hypothetical protein GMLC_31270 [Geomonas limicola]
MKKGLLCGALAGLLLVAVSGQAAEKWDQNSYTDNAISAGYYDVSSIKSQGGVVSWTERYVLTPEGAGYVNNLIAKYPGCKERIAKEGKAAEYQMDYEVKNNKQYRGAAKRYYSSSKKLICTNKETGPEFSTEWRKIVRDSPIQQAQYDLVTKYKVKFQ